MTSTDTDFTDEELKSSQAVPINKIDEYLYLGSVEARREEILREHQIGRVIWLTTEAEQLEAASFLPEGIKETVIYLSDSPTAALIPAVLWAQPLIDKSIQEKENVLIHCWQGVSRSASTLIGYLIKSRRMTAKEALAFVEKGRLCVWPNKGFWSQLVMFEQEERIKR